MSGPPEASIIRMIQKPPAGYITLVGEAVGIFEIPVPVVSATAFGLAGRTATTVLPVCLAAIRIKHLSADTAGALTASHGILEPPLRERIPKIRADYLGGGRVFSTYPQNEQKKEKGGPKRKKRLLLIIFIQNHPDNTLTGFGVISLTPNIFSIQASE